MLPATPTPPVTRNAPVALLVAAVLFASTNSPVLIVPYVPLTNTLLLFSVPVVYHSRYPVSLALPKNAKLSPPANVAS